MTDSKHPMLQLKILVPIKRVVDPYAKVRPLPDGSGVDSSGAKFEINPFDEIAMEEAVRMREKGFVSEIVAVTIGPSVAEEQLRKALAMGADRALLIESDEELEPAQVAEELERAVREIAPDLVLMGKQATDDDCNQVGQMLAARLDWPQATFACRIAVRESSLQVARETDNGEEVLELPLPCLVTSDLRLNEPRYIALPGIIKARSKPVDRRGAAVTTPRRVRTVRVELPAQRSAGHKVASTEALVEALRAKGVWS